MDIGVPELIIILLIVVLFFGSGRLVSLGKELGSGIREFRKGIEEPQAPEGERNSKTDPSPDHE